MSAWWRYVNRISSTYTTRAARPRVRCMQVEVGCSLRETILLCYCRSADGFMLTCTQKNTTYLTLQELPGILLTHHFLLCRWTLLHPNSHYTVLRRAVRVSEPVPSIVSHFKLILCAHQNCRKPHNSSILYQVPAIVSISEWLFTMACNQCQK